jgi:hypothetical protein
LSFAQLSLHDPQVEPTFQLNSFIEPDFLNKNLENNFDLNSLREYGDTSTTMGTLDKINSFMEWYMKYFPVPFGSYSKETSWLFGLSKYNAFKLRKGDLTDTITQTSSLTAFAYITLNGQYKFDISSNLMFNKNKALWKTDILYTFYPLEYFGTGNDTKLEDQRTLNSSDFQFSSYYLFRIWKKWYLGPEYDFYDYFEVELAEDSKPLPGDSIHLAHNTGRQSGLGIKLSKEGRDNRFNAKSGYFVDVNYQLFNKAIGSEYNYNYFKADVRYYITPLKFLTIAMQARTESKTGDVPIQSLSFLGGDNEMRGIYYGRYRDNVLVDSQVELRFPIYWIIGGVVFGGLGQVAPTYDQLSFNSLHYTYGIGLRLKVDSEHNVNMRFDFGFSSDQAIFIMNFSEAF